MSVNIFHRCNSERLHDENGKIRKVNYLFNLISINCRWKRRPSLTENVLAASTNATNFTCPPCAVKYNTVLSTIITGLSFYIDTRGFCSYLSFFGYKKLRMAHAPQAFRCNIFGQRYVLDPQLKFFIKRSAFASSMQAAPLRTVWPKSPIHLYMEIGFISRHGKSQYQRSLQIKLLVVRSKIHVWQTRQRLPLDHLHALGVTFHQLLALAVLVFYNALSRRARVEFCNYQAIRHVIRAYSNEFFNWLPFPKVR